MHGARTARTPHVFERTSHAFPYIRPSHRLRERTNASMRIYMLPGDSDGSGDRNSGCGRMWGEGRVEIVVCGHRLESDAGVEMQIDGEVAIAHALAHRLSKGEKRVITLMYKPCRLLPIHLELFSELRPPQSSASSALPPRISCRQYSKTRSP